MRELKRSNHPAAAPGHAQAGWTAVTPLLPSLLCAAILALAALAQPTARAQQGVATASSAGNTGGGAIQPGTPGSGSQPAAQTESLTDLDLDQLMNVQVRVTSVSKKSEDAFQAPAAIFVITSEDIRRGGFSSLPEALRMVPGLYVSRTNANYWTIAARGFASPINDKLLVLLDGRELYDPYFGGTNWDEQDVPMEDVERIEVILGPGGTLWGDNAVNGVINIITKSSRDTQGASVATSSGTDEQQTASVRYGGSLGDSFSYRVYGKSSYWDASVNPVTGASLADEWTTSQGGLRIDWKPSEKDGLAIEGQVYEGRTHNTAVFSSSVNNPFAPGRGSDVIAGQNFLVRWDHKLSDRASLSLLGYCAWTKRDDVLTPTRRNTCDIEFQHNIAIGARQSVNWGLTLFTTGDHLTENFMVSYTHPSARYNTVSGFGQYEIALIPDRFRVIVGSKFEHNGYTGFEIQPQLRAVWTPTKSQTMWAAVSRPVRLPNRFQTDANLKVAQISEAPPTYVALVGDPMLQSETLKAYEMGYRFKVGDKFSLDASIYYNDYNKLVNASAVQPPPIINQNPFYIEIPVLVTNDQAKQTHGGEIYAKFRPLKPWVISVGETELRGNGQSVAFLPRHMANVQSWLNLPHTFEFDSALYYYDAIAAFSLLGAPPTPTPTHNRIDLGISARPVRGLTVSVWGTDIGENRALESTAAGPGSLYEVGALRRSVVFKVMWESNPEQGKASR